MRLENIDIRILKAYEILCKSLGPEAEIPKNTYEKYLTNGITKHFTFGVESFSFALSREDKLFFLLYSGRENYTDYLYSDVYVLRGDEKIVLFGEDLSNAKRVLENALNKAIFEDFKKRGKLKNIYSVRNSIQYYLEEMDNN